MTLHLEEDGKSYIETDCSQEKQTDKISWLDGVTGSSPFEKINFWELFSKRK